MIATSSLYLKAVEGRTTLVRLGMSKRYSIHKSITLENDVMRGRKGMGVIILSDEFGEFG